MVLPVTAIAILCVWAAYASVFPEAAAPDLVFPKPSAHAHELSVCCDTTEVVPEFPVCPDATTEVVSELCPDTTMEVISELPVWPDTTLEVVPELLPRM